jgi:FkbM family methyltransferase
MAGYVVYDIGANVGFYALLASVLVGETGFVYAFEPVPGNLQELRANLGLNHVSNCTVIDAAVSSMDGEAAFDPSGDRCTGRLAVDGILRVKTLRLDSLIHQQGMRPPSLMKIDIEGAELGCLQGAAGLIQEFRPIIFLATHGPEVHKACLDLMTGWGYQLKSLDGKPVEMTDELMGYSREE